jgi:hypothetical protein
MHISNGPIQAVRDSKNSEFHPFPALYHARVCEMVQFRLNQAVADALVVPLAVIVGHEIMSGRP